MHICIQISDAITINTQTFPWDCARRAEDMGRNSILIVRLEFYMDKIMKMNAWSDYPLNHGHIFFPEKHIKLTTLALFY